MVFPDPSTFQEFSNNLLAICRVISRRVTRVDNANAVGRSAVVSVSLYDLVQSTRFDYCNSVPCNLYTALCVHGRGGNRLTKHRFSVRLPAIQELRADCSHEHVPLSPSSIIWSRPKGGDAA